MTTEGEVRDWLGRLVILRGADAARRLCPFDPPRPPCPAPARGPYLTAREAAAFLGISYGTFRNHAHKITKARHGRYRVEDLERYAGRRKKPD